jgi:PBP1b-binding outer membrane lipoprotein LpoB
MVPDQIVITMIDTKSMDPQLQLATRKLAHRSVERNKPLKNVQMFKWATQYSRFLHQKKKENLRALRMKIQETFIFSSQKKFQHLARPAKTANSPVA